MVDLAKQLLNELMGEDRNKVATPSAKLYSEPDVLPSFAWCVLMLG